ncbi:GNAT family N-acetyltransferase [Streptomyces sp. H27-D2]|uniref:GNAT family N-acetyltransferase n=1 Tax=Streptomyces sp. H27-D2 TaxID=3046304 RepID=UPI002DBC1FAC|nr:GNAT family N-acetyltransferase [Streptomyces sp. H27-D2]MEC4019406.1 GNAT family N-acetyltransferase [Streptomyces sp. H27-D2]
MVTIDRATADDVSVISELLGEIERYYGGDETSGDVEQIRHALFSDRPVATVLLARDGEDVVGLASFSYLWPAAGAETSLYLKELFVREPARRRGVAGAFMTRLREETSAAGCSRMEWTAERDNSAALAFYEALGAEPRGEKVFYRMTK